MIDRIVAPEILRGEVMELLMDFRPGDIAKAKQDHGTRDASAVPEIDRIPAPQVALPKEFLNCWSLALLEDDPLLDAKVLSLLPHWEFYLMEIPCSMKPGNGTRIESAEIEVELKSSANVQAPHVYRIIPEEVTDQTKETTEFGIDPSLEVKDTAKVSVGRWIKTVAMTNLKPRITGFWHEHGASWDLASNTAAGVVGTKTFYLVIQRPKNSAPCGLNLKAKAKVATRFGILFTQTRNYSYSVRYSELI
jgi:hypothetical protein